MFDESLKALKANRLEDAGFLFYAGQLRYRLELAAFPPGNEADQAETVAAYAQQIGQVLNPAIFREPTVLARVMERYDAWTPKIAPGATPPWASTHPAPRGQVEAAIVARKARFSRHMHDMDTLLLDPEYFKNFVIQQNCNMAPAGQRPTAEQCKAAKERTDAITKSKNITGLD